MPINATLAHNGTEYTAEPVTIRDTFLGQGDHGIWTVSIACTSASGGEQSAGGYRIDSKPDPAFGRRLGTGYGLDQVMCIVHTLGVRCWEAVKGTRCYALRADVHGMILGIADLSGDRVFIFADHAAQWEPLAR